MKEGGPWYEGPPSFASQSEKLEDEVFLVQKSPTQKKPSRLKANNIPPDWPFFSSKINNAKSTHFLLNDNLTPWSRRWGPTKMSKSKETNIYKKRPTKETLNKHYLDGDSAIAARRAQEPLLLSIRLFWYIFVSLDIYWSLLVHIGIFWHGCRTSAFI